MLKNTTKRDWIFGLLALITLGAFIAIGDNSGAALATLPLAIRNRFKHPGQAENEFMNYIKKANLPFDNDKTIASVAYYHAVLINSATNAEFFAGNFVANNTNVPGNSFVRPNSEHALIYAFRVAVGDGTGQNPAEQVYTPGTGANIDFDNSIITVSNNGTIVLRDFPLSEALDGLTTRDQGLIMLDEPILWAGQTSMPITWKTKSQVGTTDDICLKITAIGLGLVS